MEYSFPRYLLAKQSVDDRALNRHVLEALRAHLPPGRLRVIEVGAGMGNMLARLLSWGILTGADYVHVDAMEENIRFAGEWLAKWAEGEGLQVERAGENGLRIYGGVRDVSVTLVQAEVMEFIAGQVAAADLLVAHAFLDLLPMPESMPRLLTLTRNLAWLTVNFDGVTSMQPVIDPALDDKIERLYHATMDTRATGGDSRAGRHLFQHLHAAGAEVLAAGSSDWVVYARDGRYPPEEDYFLYYILHFFEEALHGNPEVDANALQAWLKERRAQVGRGELVYIAHQMDFLARVNKSDIIRQLSE